MITNSKNFSFRRAELEKVYTQDERRFLEAYQSIHGILRKNIVEHSHLQLLTQFPLKYLILEIFWRPLRYLGLIKKKKRGFPYPVWVRDTKNGLPQIELEYP